MHDNFAKSLCHFGCWGEINFFQMEINFLKQKGYFIQIRILLLQNGHELLPNVIANKQFLIF
jgi:hypothetical protein